MNTYEITFITKEDLKESIVKKTVEALGGQILSEVKLGQKNFVYPIKKEKSGFYTSLVFALDSLKVTDLNRKLLLEEEILRFLIVSVNANQEMTEVPEAELKPEEVTGKPEDTTAIIEPEQAIIEAPVEEIVVAEPQVNEVVAEEEVKEEVESLDSARDKEEKKTKKTEKSAKKDQPEADQPVAEKPAKKEKAVKEEKETAKTETNVPAEDEEERLEALDKKLEELLKD